jgi:rRNA biogenesis protein RRP5
MSSLKRKDAPGSNRPSKAAKASKESGPSKRDVMVKAGKKDAKGTPQKGVGAVMEAPKSAIVSYVQDEEPMFPRGGANVLTPLEQKLVHAEAKADALREQEFDTGTKGKKTTKKSKATASSKSENRVSDRMLQDGDPVKIESLNYKVRKSSMFHL